MLNSYIVKLTFIINLNSKMQNNSKFLELLGLLLHSLPIDEVLVQVDEPQTLDVHSLHILCASSYIPYNIIQTSRIRSTILSVMMLLERFTLARMLVGRAYQSLFYSAMMCLMKWLAPLSLILFFTSFSTRRLEDASIIGIISISASSPSSAPEKSALSRASSRSIATTFLYLSANFASLDLGTYFDIGEGEIIRLVLGDLEL